MAANAGLTVVGPLLLALIVTTVGLAAVCAILANRVARMRSRLRSLLWRQRRALFALLCWLSLAGGLASASLDVPAGAWRLEGRLGWQALRFDGDRLAAVGATPTGAPFLVRVDGELRADTLKSATVGLRRTGDWLFGAEYTLAANSSNSFRSGFVRHVWRAFATLELPAAFLVSAQLDLQRVVYDDPQFITLETFIEDENRSSGKLRVERPLAGRWSGVMHLGAWLSPFGGGPAFSRQTALLGVACHLED